MWKPIKGVCFYLTFILTVFCTFITAQKLEILPAQPEQTKPIGKSLLLTCKTDTSDPNGLSELQWTDNKGRVVEKLIYGNTKNPTMYTEVLPDAGVTLYITSLTEDMAGEYTCTAFYSNTEPLKASVNVKTIHPIKWLNAPEAQNLIIHTDQKIDCVVESIPAPTVDWLKDGETITTSDKYVIDRTGLIIKNVQESDDGIYACRAAVYTTGELDTKYIKAEVIIPPKIEPMESFEIVEGDIASVQCKATGKPPPSYKWVKLSTKQDLSQTDRFSVNPNTGLLTINRVQHDDHSNYECLAKNKAGERMETVRINVLMKPQIYEFINVTAAVNDSTKIICKVRARPRATVTFKKFGSPNYFVIGQQPDNNNIILEEKVNGDETFGILNFLKLNRSDDGLYECMGENKAGKSWKTGHTTVEFAPTFEASQRQPPVWTWDNKPGNLSCIAEAIPNATYEWRFNDYPLKTDSNFKIENKYGKSFLIVTTHNDRRLFARYKCIATNRLGQSEHFVELKQGFPPKPIQQVKVLKISATNIEFDIYGPATTEGLPVTSFITHFKDEREASWIHNIRNKTWTVGLPYTVENLIPEKTYVFRFAAINLVGIGDWITIPPQTMSRRSVPDEPAILSSVDDVGFITSPYSDNFELRWKVPDDNGETITMYDVKCCPVRRSNDQWIRSTDDCFTTEVYGADHSVQRISPLDPDMYYKIELRAFNSIGYSTPAEIVVKTARGSDTPIYKHDGATISSAAIIGIVIAVVLVFLIIVDLSCYCCNRAGILMAICERTRKMPPDDEDPKLGRDEKEPLKPGDRNPVVTDGLKKSTSVEYDGNRVTARTGEIIGKNSAV